MFTALFSILSTRDLPRLVAFYRDGLGGAEAYRFPDEGDPAYVALTIAGTELGIAADPDAAAVHTKQRVSLWVYTEDCDTAVERLVSLGATVKNPPADQPWGERVADLYDPDGNWLHVATQPD